MARVLGVALTWFSKAAFDTNTTDFSMAGLLSAIYAKRTLVSKAFADASLR